MLAKPLKRALAACSALALGACASLPSGVIQDAMDAMNSAVHPPAVQAPDVRLADAPRRALRPGDTFVFGRSTVRRVSAVATQHTDWTTTDGRAYRTGAHFFTPTLRFEDDQSLQTSSLRGNPGALWPLRVGKSVSFTEQRKTTFKLLQREQTKLWRWDCSVLETRHVSVPAGDYDTFHVRCAAVRPELSERVPLQVVSWDYAPAIGHYVRRQWFDGGRARESVLSAALPAALATPARIEAVLARLEQAR